MSSLILIIFVLPILGGFIEFLLKKKGLYSTVFLGLTLSSSILLLYALDAPYFLEWEWVSGLTFGIRLDNAGALLIAFVCLISMLVHLFSITYMKDEKETSRYFLQLGFFTSSMIGLLMADHLILLFIFWELVGFSSYLLIGFWYRKEGVPSSSRMAFMVNRIADALLISGILLLNAQGESLLLSQAKLEWPVLASLLIVMGAFGKSAQFPFSSWLTRAMVGPTPVSALIHAATMVAAGVYLLYRTSLFMPENTLLMIATIGVITTLYGAISALAQYDIKKVLAYSTISQLGYMMIGIGSGAAGAAMFHLWTHAFFKAGLFLSAGSVIHYLHFRYQDSQTDTQDIRLMGGLKDQLPWTYRAFLVCGLALAGVPLFSGFISKEGIILASLEMAQNLGGWTFALPIAGLFTALLTAIYIGRLFYFVFWRDNRSGTADVSFHETYPTKIPLSILALGSIWFVYSLNPLAHHTVIGSFFGETSHSTNQLVQIGITIISIFLVLSGLYIGYLWYKKSYKKSQSKSEGRFTQLSYHGFYLNRFYEHSGSSILSLARGLTWIEKRVIDQAVHLIAIGGVVFAKGLAIIEHLIVDGLVNFSAWIASLLGRLLMSFHTRDSQLQIFWLVLGLILILSWILLF